MDARRSKRWAVLASVVSTVPLALENLKIWIKIFVVFPSYFDKAHFASCQKVVYLLAKLYQNFNWKSTGISTIHNLKLQKCLCKKMAFIRVFGFTCIFPLTSGTHVFSVVLLLNPDLLTGIKLCASFFVKFIQWLCMWYLAFFLESQCKRNEFHRTIWSSPFIQKSFSKCIQKVNVQIYKISVTCRHSRPWIF